MFETERFKTRLREAIVGEAMNQGFTQYEIGIVELLQLRAIENASVLTALTTEPGLTPRFPVTTVGPVLVTVEWPNTAKP